MHAFREGNRAVDAFAGIVREESGNSRQQSVKNLGLPPACNFSPFHARALASDTSFETGFDGWSQESFIRHSGSTGSYSTGPQGAASGSYYVYAGQFNPEPESKRKNLAFESNNKNKQP